MRLLMIKRDPWGSGTDAYKLASHASRAGVATTYLCFAGGQAAAPELPPGCRVLSISRAWGGTRDVKALASAAVEESRKGYDLVYVYYFPRCSMLARRLSSVKSVVDVRTASVARFGLERRLRDVLLRLECRYFDHVVTISESLKGRLFLPPTTDVVPAGADPVELIRRSYERLRLLYVGTFFGRRLERTIDGLARFRARTHGSVPIEYSVVGDGPQRDRKRVMDAIARGNLRDSVVLRGRIPHHLLAPVLQEANVGVSFVPITRWYQCQPPTKTYEYLQAGLPVIATSTIENKRAINRMNGVLVDDTADGFCSGLQEVWARKHLWSSDAIQRGAQEHSWSAICERYFIPALYRALAHTPRERQRLRGKG